MARVVCYGGTVAIIDLVAPDDPLLATNYNHLERLRDPSHSEALIRNALIDLAQGAGLHINHVASRDIEVNVKDWLDLSQPPAEVRTTIFERLNRELETHEVTGMRAFMRGGELWFTQTWVILAAVKNEW